jgi:hypothetical protein
MKHLSQFLVEKAIVPYADNSYIEKNKWMQRFREIVRRNVILRGRGEWTWDEHDMMSI